MSVEDLTEAERRILASAARYDARFDFTMKVGGLVLLAAGGVLAWQCWTWLQTARWPAYSVRDLLDGLGVTLGRVSWTGVQMIVDWVASSPAPGALLVIGMGILWSAFIGGGAYDAPGLNRARVKEAAILIERQKADKLNPPGS
jgi:hypothetical protein